MSERADYQTRRFALLSANIDVPASLGLEVGACDLPTVTMSAGNCRYADFRTSEEMARMWNLPAASVCPVHYLLARGRSLPEQIPDRFDYIIACHVLEHVPDVVSYINDLRTLLNPGAGKVIFVTLPDKRATLDRTRASTTVERLLGYHHSRISHPLFDHVLEFHRHWVGYSNGSAPLSLREAYDYADNYVRSGEADAHCHVWEDHEFLTQCEELIDGGFLNGLRVAHFEPLMQGSNEFAILLETTSDR